MALTILTQGKTAIRTAIAAIISFIGVSTDNTAFAVGQTLLNPGGGTNLIKAATITPIDAVTFDATVSIDGNTEFTNLAIYTIGAMNGNAAANALCRIVRGANLGIGVQSGDAYTIGARAVVSDAG